MPEETSSNLPDRIFLQNSANAVRAIDVRSGETAWSSELRLPERFMDEIDNAAPSPSSDRVFRGVADGQIGAFLGTDGVYGVGLVTGKRLWAVPFDDMLRGDARSRGERALACREGQVAVAAERFRLSMRRMADGTAIWERDIPADGVGRLWIHQGVVITVDALGKRADFYDRRDGRWLRRVDFQQSGAQDARVLPLLISGVLCGLGTEEEASAVIGVDGVSGERRWTIPLHNRNPFRGLFPLGVDFVGIALLEGYVLIANVGTGEVVWDRLVPSAHQIADGVLWEGTFLARDVNPNKRITLHALDVATGDTLWLRNDLPPLSRWDQPITVRNGYVAVVREGGNVQPGVPKPLVLNMIEVPTGNIVGPEVTLLAAGASNKLTNDWLFRNGLLVVGGGEGLQGFLLQPGNEAEPEEREGS
jgi:outer membrane protein assembly factor BamB